MRRILRWIASAGCCLALAAPITVTGCSGDDARSEQTQMGTLGLPLVTTAASGTEYRLASATIEYQGEVSGTISAEEHLDLTEVNRAVPAGDYLITLLEGWELQELQGDGSYAPVNAALLSDNPTAVEVIDQQTTLVQLRFAAGEDVLEFGDGQLSFVLDVEEPGAETCTAGSFRCNGSDLEQCSADGTVWSVVQTCADAASCDATAGVCGEVCDNAMDDDGDGDVDCADSDCSGDAACASDDCCTANGTPGCNDSTIESCVCAVDSYCCDTAWDSLCVDQVDSNGCGTCGTATEDCTNGVDDDGDGDADCADSDCSGDAACASGDCCTANGSPGCNDSTIESCVCAVDSYCCDTAWDSLCVDQVDSSDCGTCGTATEDCTNGVDDDGDGDADCADSDCSADPACDTGDCCTANGTPGCNDSTIESCVCAVDSFCCDTQWDSTCVSEVDSEGCGTCG